MHRTASRVKSFKRQGATILVLLLLLGAYYSLIVPTQRQYFIDRNFRLLGDMSAQIRATVNNLGNSLSHAANPHRDWLQTLEPGSSAILRAIKSANPPDPVQSTPSLERAITHIQAAISLVPTLELVGGLTTNAFSTGPAPAVPGVCLDVMTLRDSNWLELTYLGPAPGQTNLNLRIRARSELRRLITPLVNRPEFDNVLVVGPDGNVLFQLAQSPLQVHRLEIPLDRSFQTNLNNHAGADYRLFAQPVRLTTACSDSDAPLQWAICGLVRDDRFRQESMAVNYTVMVVFLFLTLLLIVSWPILNVWSLGSKGSLRSGDLVLLAFSTLTTSALLTLMVLDLYAYERMEARLDRQMHTLADGLVDHFKDELHATVRQLDRFNQRLLEPRNAVSQVNLLANPQVLPLTGGDPDPYPYLRMAFWTDRAGRQLIKWTVKKDNTPLIDLSQRRYFQQLAEDRPWTLRMPNETGDPEERRVPFSLEPVYSLNTGEHLAIFSLFPPNETEVVASLDLRLLSLANPVLPHGYGFCVVENSGRVLFHSDEQRSLRENFFVECNHDPRLRAAVYGRHTDTFNLRYAQQLHSVVVTPIPELPWSLAVFREAHVLATAQIEVVSISLLLFLIYATLLALLFGALYAIQSGSYLHWLWPDAGRAGTYRLLAGAYLAMAAAFLATILAPQDPWRVLMLALAFPMVALLLAYRGLQDGWPEPQGWRTVGQRLRFPTSHRVGYVACMGFLLLLISVLPTVALFKLVFDSELQLLVKQAQLDFARQLEDRSQRIWRDLDELVLPGWQTKRASFSPEQKSFFANRLANTWDVYSEFFFGTTNGLRQLHDVPAPTHAPHATFSEFLTFFRPHYNETDVRTRSVAAQSAADLAWWWTTPKGWIVLHKADFYDPVERSTPILAIGTAQPHLPAPGVLWSVGLLSLAVVPFVLAFLIGDKVLLLRIEPAAPVPPSTLGPGKYLLLGPPRSGKSELLSAPNFRKLHPSACHRLDLRSKADRELLDPSRQDELLGDPDQAIVVDHLEYHLEDAEFNRRKLQFLQRLLFDEQRTVVVVSNVHPSHFTMDPPPAANAPPAGAPILPPEDWREVLATFKPIYRDSREPDELARLADGETSHHAHLLYRALWLTCSPDEQEVLCEVAQRRLVSSQDPDLQNMLARGLLRRTPRLRLFHPTFNHFVLVNYRPNPATLLRQQRSGLWQSLKGPTITALIITAAFFFFTQQELWNHSIALMTAFVTGIGALSKGLDLYHKARLRQQARE